MHPTAGRRLLVSLFLACALVHVRAADLYVSTLGNDSNPGTATQPFRTLTRAYSVASAGTTIIVTPGVYTDYQSGWGLHFNKAGTAANPIVLRSQVKGGAVIDGQNASDRNKGIYLDGSYHIIDGFDIKGGPTHGIFIEGHFNQILNCEIHHNGNTGGGQGIYSSQSTHDNRYIGNYIHDNGVPGSNLDHGLYLCGDNEMVINNVLFRNATYGLHIAGYTTVANMKVYNNVMAYNGKGGIILWMAVSGLEIKNNILYQNGLYGIDSYDAHGSGVVVDHNLFLGNGAGDHSFTGGGSDYSYTLGTKISGDPFFVNATSAAFDPHLRAGSAAINAGLNLSSVFTTDKDGVARPATGAWDIGPYVYTNVVTGPPLMPTLSFEAEAGQIVSPFVISGGTVSQLSDTADPSLGGAARYRFNITQAGDYIIRAAVNAPSINSDSFFINIDAEPIDPTMIWDIGITTGMQERVVSWRGNGTFDAPQFNPKVFSFSAGEHTLTMRGREANTLIDRITIEAVSPRPAPPQGFRVIASGP
jgi:Right handed beta helix region